MLSSRRVRKEERLKQINVDSKGFPFVPSNRLALELYLANIHMSIQNMSNIHRIEIRQPK